jgi:hypothetical protein
MDRMEAFRAKLMDFDWQYEFSDDMRVFRNGYHMQRQLFAEAMDIGGEAIDLYFQYVTARSQN